jgi:hypothetical protein
MTPIAILPAATADMRSIETIPNDEAAGIVHAGRSFNVDVR